MEVTINGKSVGHGTEGAQGAASPAPAPLYTKIPGKIPNGVFTCIGPKGHRTIKIATVSDPERPLYGKRIIYVMTGSDNLFSYTGVGFLENRENRDFFKVWKKQEGNDLHKIVLAFFHIIGSEAAGGPASASEDREFGKPDKGWEEYRYEEARNCLVCNRLLTNPESIALGVGPKCGGRGEGVD